MSQLLSDVIDEFITYRKGEGFAKNTVAINHRSLEYLLRHVGNIQTRGLSPKHVSGFKAHLLSKGMQPNTVNIHLTSLSAFFKWARTMRYIPASADPMATTRFMKAAAQPRKRVPRADFERLLDAARNPKARITVALGLYLFLRGSEIKHLRVGWADLNEGWLKVWVEKTGEWDVMPICEELDTELRRWLTFYANDQRKPLDPEWFLVPARRQQTFVNDGSGKGGGRPVEREHDSLNPTQHTGTPYRDVKAALEDFGWTTSLHEGNHTLRRSGARALFDEMVEVGDVRDGVLRRVSAMLHHKSVTTTETYLGLEEDKAHRDEMLRGRRMFRRPEGANVVALKTATEG